MIFKFPKKKIVLDCFTTKEGVLATAPIVPAIKLIPDWWKKLPQSYKEFDFIPTGTMKNCTGMVEYYKKSIVLPLWSDLIVEINSPSEYRWQFADRSSSVNSHNMDKQATDFLKNYIHLKLISPWFFKTKESINWVWSHPAYSYPNSNSVVSLPAVVNYSQQNTSNINLLFDSGSPKTVVIGHGQPMVHITPMSDRKVEICRHLISEKEWLQLKDLNNNPICFVNSYIKRMNKKEQFKNCPYNNHPEGK
jgi:hypothetical protein